MASGQGSLVELPLMGGAQALTQEPLHTLTPLGAAPNISTGSTTNTEGGDATTGRPEAESNAASSSEESPRNTTETHRVSAQLSPPLSTTTAALATSILPTTTAISNIVTLIKRRAFSVCLSITVLVVTTWASVYTYNSWKQGQWANMNDLRGNCMQALTLNISYPMCKDVLNKQPTMPPRKRSDERAHPGRLVWSVVSAGRKTVHEVIKKEVFIGMTAFFLGLSTIVCVIFLYWRWSSSTTPVVSMAKHTPRHIGITCACGPHIEYLQATIARRECVWQEERDTYENTMSKLRAELLDQAVGQALFIHEFDRQKKDLNRLHETMSDIRDGQAGTYGAFKEIHSCIVEVRELMRAKKEEKKELEEQVEQAQQELIENHKLSQELKKQALALTDKMHNLETEVLHLKKDLKLEHEKNETNRTFLASEREKAYRSERRIQTLERELAEAHEDICNSTLSDASRTCDKNTTISHSGSLDLTSDGKLHIGGCPYIESHSQYVRSATIPDRVDFILSSQLHSPPPSLAAWITAEDPIQGHCICVATIFEDPGDFDELVREGVITEDRSRP